MKRTKLTALLLTGAITLTSLTACGSPAENTANDGGKVKIVVTIFPQYDFARAVGGDNAELTMLLAPGAEAHTYEPTPQDIIAINECDLFIYVGGESDGWVDGILESTNNADMKVISLMDCVNVVEEETVEGMESEEHEHAEGADEEHDHEEAHGDEIEYDEHVWTSPKNAILIVDRIKTALCEIDSANKSEYEANAADYTAKLTDIDNRFTEIVSTAKRRTVVFGDRFPFRYFADAYGLEYYAAFPGCSSETSASAATLTFLIDKVKAENIPAVFHIELSGERVANTICEATGAASLLLHSCHNITAEDFSAGKTYVDFMTANLEALKNALN